MPTRTSNLRSGYISGDAPYPRIYLSNHISQTYRSKLKGSTSHALTYIYILPRQYRYDPGDLSAGTVASLHERRETAYTASTMPSRSVFRSTLYITQSTADMPVPSSQCIDAVSTDPPCVKDCITIVNPYQIEIKAQTHCILCKHKNKPKNKHKTEASNSHPSKKSRPSLSNLFPPFSHGKQSVYEDNLQQSNPAIPIPNQGIYQPPTARYQHTTNTDYPLTRDLQSMQVLNQR